MTNTMYIIRGGKFDIVKLWWVYIVYHIDVFNFGFTLWNITVVSPSNESPRIHQYTQVYSVSDYVLTRDSPESQLDPSSKCAAICGTRTPDPQNSSPVPYRLSLVVRLGIRTILSPDISQLGSITIGRPYKSTNGQMSGLRIVRPCKTSNWEMSGPAYERTENCPTLQISLTEKCPDWELHVLFGITGECIESLSVFTSSKANELRVDCSLHRALCVVLCCHFVMMPLNLTLSALSATFLSLNILAI